MVRVIEENNQKLYQCEECGLRYRDEEIAGKCEAWCREHHSCNIEITQYSIEENS